MSNKFETDFKNTIAALTQMVECLAVNQNVTGSSPVGGAFQIDFILYEIQFVIKFIYDMASFPKYNCRLNSDGRVSGC